MAFGRATFFFSDGAFAWTETYYSMLGNANLDALLVAAQALARKRTMMCANYTNVQPDQGGVSLDEIRVSNDDTWRDSLVDKEMRRGGPSGNYQPFNTLTARPERPYSTLLLRCDGSGDGNPGLYRRVIYMSGIPDSVINDPTGPDINNPPAFGAAFTAFRKALVTDPPTWGFKVRSKGIVAPESNIVTTAFDLPGGTTTIGVPNTNYPDHSVTGEQNYLLIRGCRWTPEQRGCNGMHAFVNLGPKPAPNPQNLTLYQILDATGSGVYKGKGKVRMLIYSLVGFDNLIVDTETHRKRGVRSGRPVGRSKKKVFVGS